MKNAMAAVICCRHRWQASAYRCSGVCVLFGTTSLCGIRLAGDGVGEFAAVIAGKPAPTGVRVYAYYLVRHHSVGAGLLAMAMAMAMAVAMVNVLPSSLASQLLQVCGCMRIIWYDIIL
jgi:hypothetical protein